MAATDDIYIHYRNYKGEVAWRRITPGFLRYASTQWHPEPQWLLRAHDLDKGDLRDFAMQNILAWSTTPPITSTSRSGSLVVLSLDGEQGPTS